MNASTEERQQWFKTMAAHMAQVAPAVTFRSFLGEDFPMMARNPVSKLRHRRIQTATFICQA